MYEIFDFKNGLTFDTDRSVAFDKVRTDLRAAASWVYNLCSFWRSDFERDPASHLFDYGILMQNQNWRYSCRVN